MEACGAGNQLPPLVALPAGELVEILLGEGHPAHGDAAVGVVLRRQSRKFRRMAPEGRHKKGVRVGGGNALTAAGGAQKPFGVGLSCGPIAATTLLHVPPSSSPFLLPLLPPPHTFSKRRGSQIQQGPPGQTAGRSGAVRSCCPYSAKRAAVVAGS